MSKKSLGNGLEALIRVPKNVEKETKQAREVEEEIKKEAQHDKPLITAANNFSLSDDKISEIRKEVDKNPRISLWSVKSAACLRYLKKTVPEFSISKEASKLLDEAIEAKYPEVWELFNEDE